MRHHAFDDVGAPGLRVSVRCKATAVTNRAGRARPESP
jgi:hypothetical protein